MDETKRRAKLAELRELAEGSSEFEGGVTYEEEMEALIVGDWAIFGATTLVHQFVHVGAHAFTGMGTYLPQDLPPYVMAAGNMARPFGINSEGLKRRGFPPEAIQGLKRAYRTLYRSGLPLEEARRQLAVHAETCEPVQAIVDFLDHSKRGIVR